MNVDYSKIGIVKTIPDDIIITFSNSKDVVTIPTSQISSIMLEKDYDNLFLPIFNINTIITKNDYKKILSNRQYATVIVRLKKYIIPTNTEKIDYDNSFYTIVMEDTFQLINEETEVDPFKNLGDKALDNDTTKDTTDNDINKINVEFAMYLCKKDNIKSYRQNNELILTGATVSDVIGYVLSSCSNKILMSPPDNTSIYNQIILPQGNMLSTINNIDQVYGIYNYGYNIYNDFDVLYMLSKKTGTAYRPNEIKNILISYTEYGEKHNRYIGSYVDNKLTYIILPSEYPQLINSESTIGETTASTFNFIDTEKGSTKIKSVDINGSEKYMVDTYNNEFKMDSMKYKIEESKITLTTVLEDVDFTFFTPNKKYDILFDIEDKINSQKYNGTYRLASYSMVSKNVGGKDFTTRLVCNMKKGV